MKSFSRGQFEELCTQVMKSVCREVPLEDEQFDTVVAAVAVSMTQGLLSIGYELPWINRIRKN